MRTTAGRARPSRIGCTLFLVSAAALIPLPAGAGTPDGETPSQETICDELQDATPGLYGLCVAYCEAQDCDTVDLALSGECRAPSPRLLDRYEARRGPDDPPMPCVAEPAECPCFSHDDLSQLQVNECFEMPFASRSELVLTDGDEIDGAIVEIGNDGWGTCGYFQDGWAGTFEIDPAEVDACQLVLRSYAEEIGLSCDPFVQY